VTRRDIRETVAEFLTWELPKLTDRVPHVMEHSFGIDDAPVVIEGADLAGNPSRLLLRGRIDRIDRSNGDRHHVFDYKSGYPPKRQGYEDGGVLQGPLYMAAITGRGMLPASAAYLSIKRRQKASEIRWDDADCERALRIALSIPGRVRAGLFEPKAAKSSGWQTYWLGADIVRVTEVYKDGSRWDG
jgi:ATP-dependent helicase/DNAse subunit B